MFTDNYFDETIFTDGSVVRDYARVNVTHEADAWLLKNLHKKEVSYAPCAISGLSKQSDIFINPVVPCEFAKNIYTIHSPGNPVTQPLRIYNFDKKLIVHRSAKLKTPITFSAFIADAIYDVASTDMTAFDMAIMITYFAMNNAKVNITLRLFIVLMPFFKQRRGQWFEYINHESAGNITTLVANTAQVRGQILRIADKPVRF